MTAPERVACDICHGLVDDIGPWCNLYITYAYCEPLRELRRRIFKADSEGDGAMVNALCAYIRLRTSPEFVP